VPIELSSCQTIPMSISMAAEWGTMWSIDGPPPLSMYAAPRICLCGSYGVVPKKRLFSNLLENFTNQLKCYIESQAGQTLLHYIDVQNKANYLFLVWPNVFKEKINMKALS